MNDFKQTHLGAEEEGAVFTFCGKRFEMEALSQPVRELVQGEVAHHPKREFLNERLSSFARQSRDSDFTELRRPGALLRRFPAEATEPAVVRDIFMTNSNSHAGNPFESVWRN